jgi:hypothetical protein
MDIIVKIFTFVLSVIHNVYTYLINASTLITNQKMYTFIYIYMSSSMAFK